MRKRLLIRMDSGKIWIDQKSCILYYGEVILGRYRGGNWIGFYVSMKLQNTVRWKE